MMARRTQGRVRRTREFFACRHGLLCLTIAGILAGLPTLTLAAPAAAAAANGAAAPSGADASAVVDASFDRNLLSGAGRNTGDLSRFERSNPVLPGVYRTDIYLNNAWVGRNDVRFAAATPDASATACVTKELFKQLGLPLSKLSAEQQAQLAEDTSCLDLGQLIPGATVVFDQPNLRLDLSVPQAWMGYRPRGYVSPEYWDNGVTAGLLNYNFNSYHSTSNGISQTSSFLGLNAGFNIGAWRLRHDSTMLWQSGVAGSPSSQHWQNIDTYLRRDIPSLRAQLTLGDSYTSGDLFDSISVRGVQLATDDRMLPDSLRGYAPTVRGVAESNARVTVRQNGVVLYETTVPPSPFTIKDMFYTGYGGDLNVSITEADGRVRTFSVPYASVPQLLRPGVSRFSLVAGQLHDASVHAHPALVQATLQHGFNNLLTGYAGVVAFNGYAAALAGSALNTRYGAFAMDLTAARTQIPGQSTQTGQSVRLSYSKILPDTNTSLTVATYRYSTSGYLGLRDALAARDYARGYSFVDPTDVTGIGTANGTVLPGVLTPAQRQALGTNSNSFTPFAAQLDRQRSRFDLSLNQHLGERGGTLYATASARDYWNRKGTDVQFQLGYNNTFRHFSYSVSATRVRDIMGRYSNQYFASFTVPLGSSAHAPMFGASVNHDGTGRTLDQLMLNGTAGTDNQFSYGATASHDTRGNGNGNSGTVYGGYRSPYAQLNASYGKGSDYSQSSFGLSGGIVAHPGGITFGQPMGDTVAIVVAPDAQGARVLNAAGVRIDRFGYALVPFLTPYNLNTVQIDPKGLPLSVQMDATSAQVAPHLGSVVMVKFKTSSGRSLIVRVRQANGQAVPFGAEVVDEQNHTLGVVGQAGRILVRGVKDSGRLSVQWKIDDETPMICSFTYQLPPGKKGSASDTYEKVEATCTPQPDAVAQTTRNGT